MLAAGESHFSLMASKQIFVLRIMSVLTGTAEPSGCTHTSVQIWNEQSLGCGSRLGSWFPTGGGRRCPVPKTGLKCFISTDSACFGFVKKRSGVWINVFIEIQQSPQITVW